jgi:hypothetical protein
MPKNLRKTTLSHPYNIENPPIWRKILPKSNQMPTNSIKISLYHLNQSAQSADMCECTPPRPMPLRSLPPFLAAEYVGTDFCSSAR